MSRKRIKQYSLTNAIKILSQMYLQWLLRNNFLLVFRYEFCELVQRMWILKATMENVSPALEILSLISQLMRSILVRTHRQNEYLDWRVTFTIGLNSFASLEMPYFTVYLHCEFHQIILYFLSTSQSFHSSSSHSTSWLENWKKRGLRTLQGFLQGHRFNTCITLSFLPSIL